MKAPPKESQTDPESNVIPMPPRTAKATKRESEAKWGKEVMDIGYCILPSLLLRAQARLGLSGQQLVLLMQLYEHWWKNDKLPYPKKETLATRMGISAKQVQRLTQQLEKAGYIQRKRRSTYRGQTSNAIDFSGLVKRLKELAPEFASVKAAARKVETRGAGLKAKAKSA